MAYIRVKRCRSCAHKLVQNSEGVNECKNPTCPEYVPDKDTDEGIISNN